MNYALKQYLAAEYLTLEELCEKTGISSERIFAFISHQCVPPHTYELKQVVHISSVFDGAYNVCDVVIKYYHPSCVDWIKQVECLTKTYSLEQIAVHIRDDFFQQYHAKFGDVETPGSKNAQAAWDHFLNGTWGICLKEITVDCMATKELARLQISKLVQLDNPQHSLNEADKKQLAIAIKAYDVSAKKFAPHIASTSSRETEVEPARKKYLSDQQIVVAS